MTYILNAEALEAARAVYLDMTAGMQNRVERVIQAYLDALPAGEMGGLVERLRRVKVFDDHPSNVPLGDAAVAAILHMQMHVDVLQASLAKVTDPEYLATAIETVGMVDAEWQSRAQAAEARLANARAVIEPIAEYATAGILASFPDEATVDITVEVGDLRRARSFCDEEAAGCRG